MKLPRFALPLLVGALSLSACGGLPPHDTVPVARELVTAFEAEGRLSVRDGEQVEAIGIVWEHGPGFDRVDFVTPLGQIVARLEIWPGEAQLELTDGTRRKAPSADLLAEQALGLRIPVARLIRWVQAVPGDDARILRLDASGRPALISEDGWLVEYLSYADAAAQAPVRRIEANWGELRVGLLVDFWQAK